MIVYRCATCNSDNIWFDAAHYPNTGQTDTFDDCYCNDCECETTPNKFDEPDEVVPPGKIYCTNCDD